MADTPFFRGQNRMDWLYSVMLQTCADWGSIEQLQNVANILGPATIAFHFDSSGIYPAVYTVKTDDYLFIVSESTKQDIQWIGNVLGSVATTFESIQGAVSTWFATCAFVQGALVAKDIANRGTRKIVLIGFSLGAASMTILKAALAQNFGIDSACIVFGPPRPGGTEFASGFPSLNFSGFMTKLDPVASVPPETWSQLGLHNGWTPFPMFFTYSHVSPGATLQPDGSISLGYETNSVDEVAGILLSGVWKDTHNQYLYASLLRSAEFPDMIPDGYQGFANASTLDAVATDVYSWNPTPWRWPTMRVPSVFLTEDTLVTLQVTVYIRNVGNQALGPREVYFFSGTDPLQMQGQWTKGTAPLAGQRAGLLSQSCEIYAVRTNLVGSPRKSILTKFINPIQGVKGPTEKIEASIVFFGFAADQSIKRQFHFRGIDATWITADALTPIGRLNMPLFSGQAAAQITTAAPVPGFLDVLQSFGLGIYSEVTPISAGDKIISAAKPTQDALITLTLATNTVYAPGTLIEITGCRQAPLLNAKWLVGGPAVAGQVILQGSNRFSAPVTIQGVVRNVNPAISAITSVAFNGVADRKTGRPSFLQRGRRSPQLRRR